MVRLIAPGLEQLDAAVYFQLCEQRTVVINVGSVRIGCVGFCRRGILCDKHALGDAPVRRLGLATAALAALDIFWPVAFYPGGHQEVGRNRIPAARGGLGDTL